MILFIHTIWHFPLCIRRHSVGRYHYQHRIVHWYYYYFITWTVCKYLVLLFLFIVTVLQFIVLFSYLAILLQTWKNKLLLFLKSTDSFKCQLKLVYSDSHIINLYCTDVVWLLYPLSNYYCMLFLFLVSAAVGRALFVKCAIQILWYWYWYYWARFTVGAMCVVAKTFDYLFSYNALWRQKLKRPEKPELR